MVEEWEAAASRPAGPPRLRAGVVRGDHDLMCEAHEHGVYMSVVKCVLRE